MNVHFVKPRSVEFQALGVKFLDRDVRESFAQPLHHVRRQHRLHDDRVENRWRRLEARNRQPTLGTLRDGDAVPGKDADGLAYDYARASLFRKRLILGCRRPRARLEELNRLKLENVLQLPGKPADGNLPIPQMARRLMKLSPGFWRRRQQKILQIAEPLQMRVSGQRETLFKVSLYLGHARALRRVIDFQPAREPESVAIRYEHAQLADPALTTRSVVRSDRAAYTASARYFPLGGLVQMHCLRISLTSTRYNAPS